VDFRGTFDYSLDAKNRLTVPAKFRASLSDGVILAKGLKRCIGIWAPAAFEAYTEAALAGLHPLSDDFETLTRFFSNGSHDTELDAAGRVMVPKDHLRYAGLRKEVIVTGTRSRLEIWDRAGYAELEEGMPAEVARITERLSHAS
jgi:transcriptional regulator MraZ